MRSAVNTPATTSVADVVILLLRVRGHHLPPYTALMPRGAHICRRAEVRA